MGELWQKEVDLASAEKKPIGNLLDDRQACGMDRPVENAQIPAHFALERELVEQLSGRPGHQRCIEGDDELLLVLHEVPLSLKPERTAVFFWKDRKHVWHGPNAGGLGDMHRLLDGYTKAIDQYEEALENVHNAREIFTILRHATPLARSTRNLVAALGDVLDVQEDHEITRTLDRAKELERAAELLTFDARTTLELYRTEQAEDQAEAAEKLTVIAFRLNLLAGLFLPLVAMGGLFGMNVKLPKFVDELFWGIFVSALTLGIVLVWFVSRKPKLQ